MASPPQILLFHEGGLREVKSSKGATQRTKRFQLCSTHLRLETAPWWQLLQPQPGCLNPVHLTELRGWDARKARAHGAPRALRTVCYLSFWATASLFYKLMQQLKQTNKQEQLLSQVFGAGFCVCVAPSSYLRVRSVRNRRTHVSHLSFRPARCPCGPGVLPAQDGLLRGFWYRNTVT